MKSSRLWGTIFVITAAILGAMTFFSCTDSIDSTTDTSDENPPADTIPPASVTDLSIDEVGDTFCVLSWSAVDDAQKFSLRFARDTLTEQLWDSATVFSDDIFPGGDRITASVGGLEPGVFYCFGVKGCDTAGNWSALSNVVCCSTLTADTTDTSSPPPDTVPPPAITDLNIIEGYCESPTIYFTMPDDSLSSCIVKISADSMFTNYDSMVIYSPVGGEIETLTLASSVYIPGEINYICAICVDIAGNVSDNSNIIAFKQVYQIMAERCISCGRCYSTCSYGAISYNSSLGVYVIDPERCECCGECVSRCPRNAIHRYIIKF